MFFESNIKVKLRFFFDFSLTLFRQSFKLALVLHNQIDMLKSFFHPLKKISKITHLQTCVQMGRSYIKVSLSLFEWLFQWRDPFHL